eukprot:CAMPEP_0194768088 /NCGR_PEP_ID=MMETSP0323_2-20130528/38220_1 /TAXON_ID=2866 ORGANISM="Crypthecodinium cohnii, Strain Seligo" /NCGR_SAMPLE_ID=MMETSP0323_2 /ASSEMBLY_ACC=CAM_ASM_000346 /LENGTH=251 /DNA_ID=CAMNT_0039700233 /DNA_START=357 /DNA_END=1113 /DNA_ORIENTATION=-
MQQECGKRFPHDQITCTGGKDGRRSLYKMTYRRRQGSSHSGGQTSSNGPASLSALVLGAVPVLRREAAACALDGMLDVVLRVLHIDLRLKDEVLVVHVAAKVGVDPALVDRVLLFWQGRVFAEVLGQGIVDRKTRQSYSNAVCSEGWSNDESPQVRPVRRFSLQDFVLDAARRPSSHKLVQCTSEPVHLSWGVFAQLHEEVVLELGAQASELRSEGMRDDVVKPPQELVADDVGEWQRNCFDQQFQVPERF